MTTRPVSITTSLGDDSLVFRSMTGREEIGRPFHYEIELLSNSSRPDLSSLVGQAMTVRLALPEGQRYFNGVVSQVDLVGGAGSSALYRATLRPLLWRLKLRSGCRIFQHTSVPEIIRKIFREHGLMDYSESLSRTYKEREYTVQYRETDFDFVSRWMEREGIYYFFRHDSDRHTIVLADSYSAHRPTDGYKDVPYYPKQASSRRERDHIDGWGVSEELVPCGCVLDDYDFTRPRASLMAKLVSRYEVAEAPREMYDYPGGYTDHAEGDSYARIRLEQCTVQERLIHAEGNARGVVPGALFSLSNHPRADQNREYLVVATKIDIGRMDYESTKETVDDHVFRSTLWSIPSAIQFRSQSTTPRACVRGTQTALVVGRPGEEIWTDQYGRVKLQFHWDREGESNENASCWVRVAQVSAGVTAGAVNIPRIGQEVVVEFLEGDPDRPVVTGRVFNRDNMPPYELPTNKTQSGIKSRSSGGRREENLQHFNEFRFEDKKGAEQVYLQAERNFDTYVKNDETHKVDRDRKKVVGGAETATIGGKRTEEVGGDENITIRGSRAEEVKGSEAITIGGGRAEAVGGNEEVTIQGDRGKRVHGNETTAISGTRSEQVDGSETITIGGARTERVDGNEAIKISGTRASTVDGSDSLTVNGGRSSQVAGDDETRVGGGRSHNVASDAYTVGGDFVVNAGRIVLNTRGGSIVIESGGNITIKGVVVKVDGSADLQMKGAGTANLRGGVVHLG